MIPLEQPNLAFVLITNQKKSNVATEAYLTGQTHLDVSHTKGDLLLLAGNLHNSPALCL